MLKCDREMHLKKINCVSWVGKKMRGGKLTRFYVRIPPTHLSQLRFVSTCVSRTCHHKFNHTLLRSKLNKATSKRQKLIKLTSQFSRTLRCRHLFLKLGKDADPLTLPPLSQKGAAYLTKVSKGTLTLEAPSRKHNSKSSRDGPSAKFECVGTRQK